MVTDIWWYGASGVALDVQPPYSFASVEMFAIHVEALIQLDVIVVLFFSLIAVVSLASIPVLVL